MEVFAGIASWERSFQNVSHPVFKACQASTDGFGELYPTEVDVEHLLTIVPEKELTLHTKLIHVTE
jgi:hypothetical protein